MNRTARGKTKYNILNKPSIDFARLMVSHCQQHGMTKMLPANLRYKNRRYGLQYKS